MRSEVAYGNTLLSFSITRSSRNTLAIEVHPDQSIHTIAPENADLEEIQLRVLKRGSWIVKQQQFFDQFLPKTPKREYVSGETHRYLGRSYLLRIRKAAKNEVKLKGGDLLVSSYDPANRELTKKLLGDWYYKHSKKRFEKTILECLKGFKDYKLGKPELIVKRMKMRWGSCTPEGKVILNPEIIKAPSKCIEYVVIHELCHLVHPNHSKEFYRLMQEVMPDWEKRKMKLEKMMV